MYRQEYLYLSPELSPVTSATRIHRKRRVESPDQQASQAKEKQTAASPSSETPNTMINGNITTTPSLPS